MKKKIRIMIGLLVSIPICLVVRIGTFLGLCVDEYKGWWIDFDARQEQKQIDKAAEGCRKRSCKASGIKYIK